jgi:POT family proton-dependent oligopeptide transporter
MSTAPSPAPAASERTFLGHPIGLYVLFFTELWERFNFYGMRALLIFYMTKSFLFDDKFANLSYGAYNGLVYATPLFGGMLADRLLGYRRSILLGGILMAAGEFGLSFIGFGLLPQGVWSFYVCLSLIIAGNGFFKPNISTMVGSLYKQGDPRRDGAFTIFYMGINIGAAVAPIICGWIGETYGYHWGFGIAGAGMVFGLVCFTYFKRHLGGRGEPPALVHADGSPKSGIPAITALTLAIIAFVPLGAFLVSRPHIVELYAAPLAGVAFLVYVIFEGARSTPAERKGMVVAVVLTAFSVMFWAFYEQAGSSINLFTDRFVDRKVCKWEIPASVFQFVPAIFVVIFAPIFSLLWLKLGRIGRDPSSAMKFAWGLVLLGVGFVALVLAGKQADGGAKASLALLTGGYLFHVFGELCLSPVGLSMITKMAPARLGGFMMGTWFLSAAFAHILAGTLASYSADWGFTKLYTIIFICAFASGGLLLVVYPLLKKWEKARLASHHEAEATR